MIAFIVGLITGFLMCIPIGPINIWVINTHLKRSARRALAIALGGSVMDFVYFFLILSGLSFIEINENVEFYFKIVGLLLIFGLGVKEILSKQVAIEQKDEKDTPRGLMAGFMLGVIIYTSNPTLIVTMTGLGTFIKSLKIFDFTMTNIILNSLGLAIGSFFWFVFLVKVVDRFQDVIRNKYLNYFTKISGVLMVFISIFMGTKLYN